ncbi:unnamed protein product, partial [Tetraodon nigroviridis]
QHDVQELNRILFSALEHSLVGTSGSTFIQQLYRATIVNSIVCKECGNITQRQDFLHLTACVCGLSNLEDALWNMYCINNCLNFINKCPFSFHQTSGEECDYSYELFSVIIHKGGCYGGHYHVYIRDVDELGQWEPHEEEYKPKCPKKTKEEVKIDTCEPKLHEDDPLSVITTIITQEPSKSVLLDQLGQKLMDKIGSSWSKKFRKHHGPIGKFLQSHNDVFMLVSNGSRVALKANPPSPVTKPPSPAEQTSPSRPSSPTETRDPEPKDKQGSHWFDLNDSTVTPIRESDIEKQFQGKESAYMLFYRKTQLHRPREALHNPQYKVPLHLTQMAHEENNKLQKMREEFEAVNNTVELRLHLALNYRLQNGALQPVTKEQDCSAALSFDRRRTVGDLRLAIYQMQELWEGDMALTVAKSLPAGLHLSNTLTGGMITDKMERSITAAYLMAVALFTDDGVSLCGAGIHTNTDLFVWNGKEVCGVTIRTGSEWEPVLLTVVRLS